MREETTDLYSRVRGVDRTLKQDDDREATLVGSRNEVLLVSSILF